MAHEDAAFDATMPGDSAAYSPDHEDYLSPEERAEAQALFRPGRLVGAHDAEHMGRAYRKAARAALFAGEHLTAADMPRSKRAARLRALEEEMNAVLEEQREEELRRRANAELARGLDDSGETALLIAGTVAVGALAGWLWKKHRQAKAAKAKLQGDPWGPWPPPRPAPTKSVDLVGLDVLLAR